MNTDSTININQPEKMTSVLSKYMFHPSDKNTKCDCIGFDNPDMSISIIMQCIISDS